MNYHDEVKAVCGELNRPLPLALLCGLIEYRANKHMHLHSKVLYGEVQLPIKTVRGTEGVWRGRLVGFCYSPNENEWWKGRALPA